MTVAFIAFCIMLASMCSKELGEIDIKAVVAIVILLVILAGMIT